MRWFFVWAMLWVGVSGACAQGDGRGLEYEVKAAFLYNFVKFVEWPTEAFESADSPIRIGLFGADPFDGTFEAAVQERKVWNRSIVVEIVDSIAAASEVHMLFVVSGEENRLREELAALHDAGVLTVGESSEFKELGGVITFTLRDGKVRFFINRGAAAATGIQFRAQLLQLALTEPRS